MKNTDAVPPQKRDKNDFPGYPIYPSDEDIYNKAEKEQRTDSEVFSNTLLSTDEPLRSDTFGTDLDVPGADVDDNQENIGNEDEENNYYSIGGDNHNDLEEDQGDD